MDSIPILAITGENVRAQLGREAFQAVDIAEVVKPITKKAYCVKDGALVPRVFREAFRIMKEGRPGPVLIDLPLDVQKEEIEYDPETDAPLPIFRTPPNENQIAKALDMLLEAEKPVMLLGGGVILADACEEFKAIAEACGTLEERVTDPNELKAAFQRGIDSGIPYIIDVIIERETDCSMGLSIDNIREFE